ncbi:RNA polymerase sigma factor, sigma-70 family protein [Collimonas fungivorans]|uniref:RNA polymerase sigma factor, sigma-70 family protein n=1 Tax=Collimonas fungivorans TaxID=158899 RepID=A0A127PDP9_9BURK|nr:sigma-70 family RNA polymerase sigma factor [Collimonas fungivorans]AMO95571.1 RNA polymerase sigma factor, sigma-70 family protein [Collimonas fungivorans]
MSISRPFGSHLQSQEDEAAGRSMENHEESLLWQRWRERGDSAARESLARHYLPYARTVAASYYAKRFHDEIEFAEYMQLASVGMMEAIDRYDPGFGAQFKTYAARRMHGAILNGLEHLTDKQQQIAVRQRLLSERLAAVKNLDGDETAQAASKTSTELFRDLAQIGVGLALTWLLADTGMIDSGAETATEMMPVYRGLELKQLQQRVRAMVHDLSEQERLVIQRHYLLGISFSEIAEALELSAGRIAQIHRKALRSLRNALREQKASDVFW